MLFSMASKGNKECYEKLFDEFMRIGKIIAANQLIQCNAIKYLKPDDFTDTICELFLITINTFDPKVNKFEVFSRFILNKRLARAIWDTIERRNNILSLDQCDDDSRPLIESIEDKSIQRIPDQISMKLFEEQLAESGENVKKNISDVNEVIKMEMEGYSLVEISRILKISMGRIRYLKRIAYKKLELDKIKLELK